MKIKKLLKFGVAAGASATWVVAGCIVQATAGMLHLLTVVIALDQSGRGAALLSFFLPVIAEIYWFFRLGWESVFGVIVLVWLGLCVLTLASVAVIALVASSED